MNNIYDLLVISIKNIEVECHKHKNKEEYLLKKRLLKDILTHLHEIRRKIQDNLDKKIK
ncbi:hypothetical protein PJV89_02630 [Aliarcobacter butzleri]|uniref:Uncharacterized protein n=1 Tax=Aliarcobacter butzleri L352 TaxID=1447260 RepID=A0A837JC24_9BACT|nr:hypothetical protein [Aliarcobacter butzleri]KLE05390.1 hypothetical protein AF77_05060 [Aliarcobacter butzleri L352]MCG3673170.1 hypothetical protein [Aliarcobacter butzleri]MCG3707720.1 hypothetical protein [Aliarcobacter butzleri]MCT7555101.1 hypothetical protein [Aliarcobacter butzleri]MCT7590474.1 hypothetical protein [Aliarcobacter butzleri]